MSVSEREAAESWDRYLTSFLDHTLVQSFGWGNYKAAQGWTPLRWIAPGSNRRPLAMAQTLFRSYPLSTAIVWCPGGLLGPIECWSSDFVDEIARTTGARNVYFRAAFSRDEHGSLLGARGDAGIFSFRKTIAVPDGAALVVNGSGEMPPAPPVKASGTPPARYRVKQAFRRVAGPFGAVGALDAIRAVRGARRVFTGHAIPSGAADAETSIPVGPEPTTAIMRPITVADPELETQRRRALYDVAARVLSKTSAIPVFPSLPRYVVPYGFPIFVDPSDAPRVAATIGRYGFQLAGWPDLPSAVAAEAPEHYHHLMVLPFLW